MLMPKIGKQNKTKKKTIPKCNSKIVSTLTQSLVRKKKSDQVSFRLNLYQPELSRFSRTNFDSRFEIPRKFSDFYK